MFFFFIPIWSLLQSIEKGSFAQFISALKDRVFLCHCDKKRSVITEYLIQTSHGPTWFSKQDALKLAFEGRLHATIVHLKTGTYYLRPEYGSNPFECVT